MRQLPKHRALALAPVSQTTTSKRPGWFSNDLTLGHPAPSRDLYNGGVIPGPRVGTRVKIKSPIG